eukprot:Nitzschia sp. Nitz4//scaffold98_size77359//19592//20353//NITZ4_005542-RA/size77359-processed-gene-0.35-mRNA-1//-1//CDS//3329560739//8735//frame0
MAAPALEDHHEATVVAIRQALNEAIDRNNHGADQMRAQDYQGAMATLSQALAHFKEHTRAFRSRKTALKANFGVYCRWDSSLESSQDNAIPIFQGPIRLCPFEEPAHHKHQGATSFDYSTVLASLSIVCNLGLCQHLLGEQLLGAGRAQEGTDVLQKALRLYECSQQLVEGLNQSNPIQLILLCNMGQVCLRLRQEGHAKFCYHKLSIASAEFRRNNQLYRTDEGIRAMVDALLSYLVLAAWSGFSTTAAAAA